MIRADEFIEKASKLHLCEAHHDDGLIVVMLKGGYYDRRDVNYLLNLADEYGLNRVIRTKEVKHPGATHLSNIPDEPLMPEAKKDGEFYIFPDFIFRWSIMGK